MRGAWAISLMGLGACAPELPEPQWFGRYVALATEDSLEPCAATIPVWDQFIEETFELLDEPIPDDFSVTIYILHPAGSEDWTSMSGCSEGTFGCVHVEEPSILYAQSASFVPHELVHTVVLPTLGRAPPLFEEGLAENLGPAGDIFETFDVEDVPVHLDPFDQQSGDYRDAGAFVRFLISRHGVSAFKGFYGSIGSDSAWEKEFESRFAESSNDAINEFLAEPQHCTSNLFDCFRENLPGNGVAWELERSLSCAHPEAFGFLTLDSRDSAFEAIYGLDVPQGARYDLSTSSPITLGACTGCGSAEIPDGDATLILPEGRYAVVATDAGPPDRVWRLRLQRASDVDPGSN